MPREKQTSYIRVKLGPEAKAFLREEMADKSRLDRDEVISGMICYAHWAMRRGLKDPLSIESRLQAAGADFNASQGAV